MSIVKSSATLQALTSLALMIVSQPICIAQTNELDELRAVVETMRKTIVEQNARIAALEAHLKSSPPTKLTVADNSVSDGGTNAFPTGSFATNRSLTVVGMNVPVAELPDSAVPKERALIRDVGALNDQQESAPRVNNAPLDPSLKGFFPILGTETILRIGGYARVDAIVDSRNNGNQYEFQPSSIPVPGQPGSNGGEQSTLSGKGTRLEFELRRPVAFNDTLRIFNQWDFFGNTSANTMDLRLRHFYGQAWNILIGQTYSAFMDIDVWPDVVDYKGPNGILDRRQPQIRYTLPIHDEATKLLLVASIEQPSGQIDTSTPPFPTGSTTVNHVPDGVMHLRWEGALGHFQGGAVFRDLAYESDQGPSSSVLGWGLNASGSLNVLANDKLSWQVTYGEGIAHYVNDLTSLSLDAALDDGKLKAIPVLATMAAYTHQWGEHWRSTVSGGYVHVDAPASLGPFAIDHTIYTSANIMWRPTKSLCLGLEYLYGLKETSNGSEQHGHRVNLVLRYDLVR